MKYIRTINNIYQNDSHINRVTIIEKNAEESPCLEINLGYSTYGFPMTRYEKIIKEADTIKELIEFYMIDCGDDKRENNRIYYTLQEALHYSKDCLRPQRIEHQVYGAIWVKDKGLIYAAKVNEDDELCLI